MTSITLVKGIPEQRPASYLEMVAGSTPTSFANSLCVSPALSRSRLNTDQSGTSPPPITPHVLTPREMCAQVESAEVPNRGRLMFQDDLRAARLKLGIGQAELAEKLHTTAATISRWETGSIYPPIERLEEWARALGVRLVIHVVDDNDPFDQLRTVMTAAEANATYNAALMFKGRTGRG